MGGGEDNAKKSGVRQKNPAPSGGGFNWEEKKFETRGGSKSGVQRGRIAKTTQNEKKQRGKRERLEGGNFGNPEAGAKHCLKKKKKRKKG